MCGRYTLTQDLKELEKLVRFICKFVDFTPRYNVTPRQPAPVLVWENNGPVLKPMRWGLIPSWSPDEKMGDKLINARAETLTEKTSFKQPFAKQRCLPLHDALLGLPPAARAVPLQESAHGDAVEKPCPPDAPKCKAIQQQATQVRAACRPTTAAV